MRVERLDARAAAARARRLAREAAELLRAEWPSGGSVDRRVQRLREAQQDPGTALLGLVVAADGGGENDDRCAGFAQLQAVADKGEGPACAVTSVVIDGSQRGTGLGRRLMDGVEDHARQLGYTYVYLWTSTAQGFYAKCGYHCCESVTLSRPILDSLGESKVSALERMLAKMQTRADATATAATAAARPLDHEATDGQDVVWMRKRLIEDLTPEILDAQLVRDQVCADLDRASPDGRLEVVLVDVPLHRQVGPSCGLAALRMARHHLCGTPLAPDAPSLLQEAIRRGFSSDGELYDIQHLARLATDVSGLRATVVSASARILGATSPSQLAIIPYDRGGGSVPELRHGKSAHYALVVGCAARDTVNSDHDARATFVTALSRSDDCRFAIAQHGMSRRLVVASVDQWLASNAQLDSWPGLAGQIIVVEAMRGTSEQLNERLTLTVRTSPTPKQRRPFLLSRRFQKWAT